MDKQRVNRLVSLIEAGLKGRSGPDLKVVPPRQAPLARRFDSITRDSHLQRIRYLAKGYGLRWLIEQATFDRPGLDSLEDDELIALHRDMDRAMECRRDGIPYEDADLVRPLSPTDEGLYEGDSWGCDDFRLTG